MFKSIWSVPLEQKIMEEVYMDDAIPQGKQCEEINRRIVLSALESNEISAAGGEELTKEIVDFCDFEDLSGWPIHMVKLKQKVIQKCKEMKRKQEEDRKIEKLDREKMKKLEEAKITFVKEYTKWVNEPNSGFFSLPKSDDSDINDFLIHLCFTKGFWYDHYSSHNHRNLQFHDSIFREVFVSEFFLLLFLNLLIGFMFLVLNFDEYEIKHHFNVYHCCTFVWSFPITFLVWPIITAFTSNAFQNLRHHYLPPKSHVLEKRKSA